MYLQKDHGYSKDMMIVFDSHFKLSFLCLSTFFAVKIATFVDVCFFSFLFCCKNFLVPLLKNSICEKGLENGLCSNKIAYKIGLTWHIKLDEICWSYGILSVISTVCRRLLASLLFFLYQYLFVQILLETLKFMESFTFL